MVTTEKMDNSGDGSDDRVSVSREQFFELVACDLRLLRKLLCFSRYFLSIGVPDDHFNAVIAQAEQELNALVLQFFSFFAANNIEPNQALDDFPSDVFAPPVEGRQCLFASNGIFIDTKACFQTRDIPLNVVAPFQSVQTAYFLLEHAHEALEMNCQLRLRQLAQLQQNKPDVIVDETVDGAAQITENTDDPQLSAARQIIFTVGSYAYRKTKTYEAMLER
jgi:hypothetical protein